jgi:hypothetical protein
MAEPYRLLVLKELTSLLEGIEVADGYNNDLAGKVYRGRLRFGDADPETLLSILEAPRQPDISFVGNNDFYKANLEILIQGYAADDKTHPSDPLYYLLDDVERKIHELTAVDSKTGLPLSENYLLKGMLADVKHQGGLIRPPTDGVSSRCFLYWPITLVISNVFVNQ